MKHSLIIICIVLCISACKKSSQDYEISRQPFDSSETVIVFTHSPAARIANSNGWTEYWIKSNYEANYAHWCQLWASPLSTFEKQNACAPTCYMTAAHMIAAGNNLSFMPSSANKLDAIVNHFGSLPANITQICSYVSAYDSPPLCSNLYSSTDRQGFKSFLEATLADGNPLIVPIVITTADRTNEARYCSESQTENYDIDSSPQPGRPNYILTTKASGGYGHFVVVIGIRIFTATGNGLVYYKDPLAYSSATKVCSYSRFLESAKVNGSCTEPNCATYDAVALKKQ